MVDLTDISPCDGLLPISIGSVKLSEEALGVMTSVAPFRGKEKLLSAALKKAHGMVAPGANRATGKAGARAIWYGQNMILLQGPVPGKSLSKHAALTDQSDGWAVVRLEGDHAADVLARLTPVDLRGHVFKRGHTARTELAHMMASITRTGQKSFQIMVFRSFAHTLVDELHSAMKSVTAQA